VTTLIFVENVLGSGQVVKLSEDFGDHSVSRDLKPGESARLVVSPFKSITIQEIAIPEADEPALANDHPGISFFREPRVLSQRCG
jgi:hypothetical protein